MAQHTNFAYRSVCSAMNSDQRDTNNPASTIPNTNPPGPPSNFDLLLGELRFNSVAIRLCQQLLRQDNNDLADLEDCQEHVKSFHRQQRSLWFTTLYLMTWDRKLDEQVGWTITDENFETLRKVLEELHIIISVVREIEVHYVRRIGEVKAAAE